MAEKNNNRTVPVSGELLLQQLRRRGWSVEQLSHEADVGTGTISRVLKGSAKVYWKTAESFRRALELDSIEELISQPEESAPVRRVNEWLVSEAQSQWITAANQLQYRIWKLQHEHLPKLARGKFYDLDGMSSDERERCHAALLRHAVVCTKVGDHPRHHSQRIHLPSSRQEWLVGDRRVDRGAQSERAAS